MSSLALADPNPNGPRRQQRGRAVPSRAPATTARAAPATRSSPKRPSARRLRNPLPIIWEQEGCFATSN